MGYVWCDGYVWDMCRVRYVWDMCGVRYANNLLKNPATKRLSGKKKKKAARKTSAFCVNRTGGSLTSGAIRDYFRQLGFSDEELVALVGALVSLGHMSKPCEM